MAALPKALNWVSISLLVFMLVITPLVQSSRTPIHGGRQTMAKDTATATAKQEPMKRWVGSRGWWSSADLKPVEEDSAREVPTGPNPLHHNDNPTRP